MILVLEVVYHTITITIVLITHHSSMMIRSYDITNSTIGVYIVY